MSLLAAFYLENELKFKDEFIGEASKKCELLELVGHNDFAGMLLPA